MSHLKVQTTEIHLLKNDSTIVNGNKFWLSVYYNGSDVTRSANISYNIDFAMNGAVSGIVSIETNTASVNCGCLTADAIGSTYVQVTYSNGGVEESIILKVFVHDHLLKSGSNYVFYSAYDRITSYTSRIDIDHPENDLVVFYKPAVYAKFSDGGSNESFGEITGHHYVKFLEIDKTTNNPAVGANVYLKCFKTVVPGSSPAAYTFTGVFIALKKGTEPSPLPSNPADTTHTILRVSLNSTGASNTMDVQIRIEDTIDTVKPILEKLPNKEDRLKKSSSEPPHESESIKNRILILGEGYTSKEDFVNKCMDFRDYTMSHPPYSYMKNSLEFWFAYDPSAECGITIPSYVNIDGDIMMIPGDFDYFDGSEVEDHKTFIKGLKTLIKDIGLYKDNDVDGETWFTTNPTKHGLNNSLKTEFVNLWKRTKPKGIFKCKDTRYGLLLGERRMSQNPPQSSITSYNQSYLLNWTDYFITSFDYERRHTLYSNNDDSEIPLSGGFLNRYLNSLTDSTDSVLGTQWTNLDNRKYRRNFVAFVVNTPFSFGVNRSGIGFFTNPFSRIELSYSGPASGFLYSDTTDYNSKSYKDSIDVSKMNTFIHELSHTFKIADEYEDVRAEGHTNFGTSVSDYDDVMDNANTESEAHLIKNGQFNPFDIKWNWPRIKYASLCPANPVIEDSKIKIRIHKSEYYYWNAISNAENLYIRTLEISPHANNNFVVIGAGKTGALTKDSLVLDAVNTEYYIMSVNYDTGKEAVIQNLIEEFNRTKDECCLYVRRRGMVTIENVTLKSDMKGSGFLPGKPDKPRKRVVKLKAIPKVGDYDGVEVELLIDQEGKCMSAKLLKTKKSIRTIYLTDDTSTLNNKDQWKDYNKWFDKKSSLKEYPEFEITFKPFDDSLDSIDVLDSGAGYTDVPSVSIVPNNGGVEVEVQLSEIGKSYPETSNPSGAMFSEPIYAIVRDKRNKPDNLKGKGLKGIVTRLNASGGITEVRLISHGNGLYPNNNSQVEVILELGNTGIAYPATSNIASVQFDIVAYNSKKFDMFKEEVQVKNKFVWSHYYGNDYNVNQWDQTKKSKLANNNDYFPLINFFSISNSGAGYVIPFAPLKFVLSNSVQNKALVLGYLDSNKQVEKLEILIPGKDFTPNEELKINEVLRGYEIPKLDLSFDSDYDNIHPSTFQELTHNYLVDNYKVRGDGYYDVKLTEDDNGNVIRFDYINKDNPTNEKTYLDFEWPEFKVLTTDGSGTGGKGGITGIAFTLDGSNNPKKGRNLHYPSAGLNLIVSSNGTFDEYKNDAYGSYIIEKSHDSGNQFILNPIRLLGSTDYDIDREVRLIGGGDYIDSGNAIHVEPPHDSPSGTGNIAVDCETAVNSGHVTVALKQGKSIEKITFKYDNTAKKYKRGNGYSTEPVITIVEDSNNHLAGEPAAVLKANLSLYPNILDKSILNDMAYRNSKFIDKIIVLSADKQENESTLDAERRIAVDRILTALLNINRKKDVNDIIIDHSRIDALKLLALFEGGGTYDNKIYRPTYDSLMRNSTDNGALKVGFNYITMYYILGVLDPSLLSRLDIEEYFKHNVYTRLDKKIP